MKLSDIKIKYISEQETLRRRFERLCTVRIKAQVKRLQNFRIHRIYFGNGTWTANGAPETIVYEDGDEGVCEDFIEILRWADDTDGIWSPKYQAPHERAVLKEIRDICEWATDEDLCPDDIIFVGGEP